MTPHPRTVPRAASALVTLIATAIASVHVLPATNAATLPAEDEHKVVFFAIDGFDADYLDGRVPLPNIHDLVRRGTLTTGTSVMSSMTNQA